MSKPKFNPNQPFQAAAPATAPAKPKFDPTASFQAGPTEDPSMLESFARGAGQGLSFGFADELTGGLEAAGNAIDDLSLDNFLENYRKHRDESRANYAAAEEANPIASGLGNLTGSLAPALLTGGGSLAARGAVGLGQAALRGAGVGLASGALAGAGTSNADLTKGEVSDFAGDTLAGAAMGGAIGGAMPLAGTALKGVGKVGGAVLGKAGSMLDDTQIGDDISRAYAMGKRGLSASGKAAQERVTEGVQDETKRIWESLHNVAKRAKGNKQAVIDEAEERVANGSMGNFTLDNALEDELAKIEALPIPESKKQALAAQVREMLETQAESQKVRLTETVGKNGKVSTKSQGLKGEGILDTTDLDAAAAGINPKSTSITQNIGVDKNGKEVLKSIRTTIDGEIDVPAMLKEYGPNKAKEAIQMLQNMAHEQNQANPLLSKRLKAMAAKASDDFESYLSPVGDISPYNQDINQSLEALKRIAKSKKTSTIGAEAPNDSAFNFTKNFSKDLDPALTQRKDQLGGALEAIDPRYRKVVESRLTEKAKDFDLVKRLSEGTTIGGLRQQLQGPLLKLVPKTANFVGKNINRIEQATEKVAGAPARISNALTSRTPDEIKMLAQKIGQMPVPGAEGAKLQEILTQAASRDRTSRNALLFAIQQNPAYREMLHELTKDEE